MKQYVASVGGKCYERTAEKDILRTEGNTEVGSIIYW
jgi:hypothetical protein